MTKDKILTEINLSLAATLGRDIEVSLNSHLLNDEIVDSLDAIQFFFDLEKRLSKKLPDGDLGDKGYYEIQKLVDYFEAA